MEIEREAEAGAEANVRESARAVAGGLKSGRPVGLQGLQVSQVHTERKRGK